jgi:hypothetical protein
MPALRYSTAFLRRSAALSRAPGFAFLRANFVNSYGVNFCARTSFSIIAGVWL